MKKFLKNNWILLGIIVLAIFFRYWQISTMPGGLFPDEAANGLDINSMAHGQIQPFYERGNGREAGFFYFEALSVVLFGRGQWQFHIVSAAFGVLSVIALYFLAKRLFDKRIALIAAFFLAVSSYPVTVTRTAFRATTVPLVSTLAILFLVKFFQSKDKKSKYWSAALAGLFLALGFYTYTSYRMMVPLLGGFGVLLIFGYRSRIKQIISEYTKFTLAYVAAFVAAISWIAIYYLHHPQSFVGRAGQVSVFNKTLNHGDLIGTVVLGIKKTLLSFFTHGDLNWRQNVSGMPLLSPFLSPFFAGALIFFSIAMFVFLKQVWDEEIEQETVYKGLLACWFWFMMVPELATAEGIPHGLRLIGVIPPLFIITAWGIAWVWDKLAGEMRSAPKYYFAGLFFAVVLVYNFYLFFVVAASSPDYYYAYRSDLTDVSNYLNQRNLKDRTYLSLDVYSVQTTDYLTTDYNQPYILVNPADTYQVKLKKGDQVVFTMSTLFDSKKFCETHPTAKLVRVEKNQFGLTMMAVYEPGTAADVCIPLDNPGFNTNPS
jgi:hypothetical protein